MVVFDRFLICVAEACEIGDEYKLSIKLYMCYKRALSYHFHTYWVQLAGSRMAELLY